MFAPKLGVLGVGQSNGIIQISVRPPLLQWQFVDVVWTQNRPLLSLYTRYHQDSCTKQGVYGVRRYNCESEICVR